jgi:AAA ATPase domain
LARSYADAYGAGMLVGREDEQQHLDRLLRQARAGTSEIVVLRGEPGIGKTALVDYAATCAETMQVLRVTGIETEAELAFAGLYSLLHPLAGYLAALPERQAAALEVALGLRHGAAAPERLAVAAGTHGLLTVAAEDRALLVLVDDLQWLDPASAEALLFALRRLDRGAVACVLTLRTGTPAPDGLLCRDLGGLAPQAAAQLIGAAAEARPAPAVAGRLHAETGGNPLALVELAAALTADQLQGDGPVGASAGLRRPSPRSRAGDGSGLPGL